MNFKFLFNFWFFMKLKISKVQTEFIQNLFFHHACVCVLKFSSVIYIPFPSVYPTFAGFSLRFLPFSWFDLPSRFAVFSRLRTRFSVVIFIPSNISIMRSSINNFPLRQVFIEKRQVCVAHAVKLRHLCLSIYPP